MIPRSRRGCGRSGRRRIGPRWPGPGPCGGRRGCRSSPGRRTRRPGRCPRRCPGRLPRGGRPGACRCPSRGPSSRRTTIVRSVPARRGRERRRREGVAVDRLARHARPGPAPRAAATGAPCAVRAVAGARRRAAPTRAGGWAAPPARWARQARGGRRGGDDRGLGFGRWRRLGGLGLRRHRHRDHGAAQQRAADRQPARGGRQRRPGATLAAQEVRDEPLRPRRPTTVRRHLPPP